MKVQGVLTGFKYIALSDKFRIGKTFNLELSTFNYFCTMGILKQVAEYLYLKKKDPDADKSKFTKYMHGINRISIFLFIFAMIVLAIRLFRKH